MNESDLDRLLGAARANPPAAGAGLMARVLEDALAAQPRAAAVPQAPVQAAVRPAPPVRRPGFWARLGAGLGASLGGSGVLTGLGGAALLGLAAGYADPTSLGWLTDGLPFSTSTQLELLPTAEIFLTEG